jgi:hypothetical protein
VCGVIASSPHFLLNGVAADAAGSVPELTPTSAGYAALCAQLAQAQPFSGVVVACPADGPLTVTLR